MQQYPGRGPSTPPAEGEQPNNTRQGSQPTGQRRVFRTAAPIRQQDTAAGEPRVTQRPLSRQRAGGYADTRPGMPAAGQPPVRSQYPADAGRTAGYSQPPREAAPMPSSSARAASPRPARPAADAADRSGTAAFFAAQYGAEPAAQRRSAPRAPLPGNAPQPPQAGRTQAVNTPPAAPAQPARRGADAARPADATRALPGAAPRAERRDKPAAKPRDLFADEPTDERTTVSGTASTRAGRRKAEEDSAASATRISSTRARKSAAEEKDGGKGKGRTPKKKTTGKVIFMNVLKAFFMVGCLGVIMLCIFAVSAANYIVDSTKNDAIDLDLDTLRDSQTSFLELLNTETQEVTVYQKLTGDSDSIWAPLDDMPEDLIHALYATEDREFLDHHGVNFRRTFLAMLNEVIPIYSQQVGASTIDQQLIKNLTDEKVVVDEAGGKLVGYQRKMREIYRALVLNNNYSKQMILEAYLNTFPLSGTIVGARAAASNYFNKTLDQLTLPECAMIVGITKATGAYNPRVYPDACKERRNEVLRFMLRDEYITKEEYDVYAASDLGLYTPSVIMSDEVETKAENVSSYFADTVFEEVVADLQEQYGWSRAAAVRAYYNNGYHIQITMDPVLQNEMEKLYALGIGEGGVFPAGVYVTEELDEPYVDEEGNTVTTRRIYPQSAMVVIDYTGALKGIVGGIGPKQETLGLNRAYQSPRPIGSTMKPIGTYPLGIEYGLINYSKMITDASSQVKDQNNPTRDPETGEIVKDWPKNVNQPQPTGEPMLIADALSQSANTVPVIIASQLTPELIYSFLTDTLFVTTLSAENDPNLAPMVLGALDLGMTAYELAGAYQMIGNGGEFHQLHSYYRVLDSDGNIILDTPNIITQAISPETAYIVNRLMSTVLRGSHGTETGINGTAQGHALGYMDSIAKTGSTDDYKDRWFVGMTPYYVTAVWWGYDENQELRWTGTNPIIAAWKRVMEASQADLPYKEFAVPAAIVEATFCRATGELAGPNCTDTQTGYYTEDNMPGTCALHSDDPFPEALPPAA